MTHRPSHLRGKQQKDKATPLARQNGQLYIDDLYVFSGNRSTVFVMDVNSTITGPDVQRGFHPEARYEFKVYFDGADFEALTY